MVQQKINQLLKERIGEIPARHELEKIKDPGLGDYASNLPFILARSTGQEPLAVARQLREQLGGCAELVEVRIGGKGFLNFVLSWDFLVQGLHAAGRDGFGRSTTGNHQKVLVEYVSANPTGPLNVVNGRAGALGTALVNLLKFTGFDAASEDYINDGGNQVELLRASLAARVKELAGEPAALPEGGYPGEYLIALARAVVEEKIDEADWGRFVLERIIGGHKESLERLGLRFDRFIYESAIRPRNQETLDLLKKKGFSYEQEGAVWFRASDFGDTEDRVLVKSDGNPTYFLTDLTYHRGKFERGFDRLITIWGPDHHGDIPRLIGGINALGLPGARLEILICQETHLKRGKEIVSMSKRAGDYVTLDEVTSEIGADALKFFLLMRKASQHLEFDLELAKKTTSENPVYYVQYGHARICSILKYASDQGLSGAEESLTELKEPEERELVKAILDFPDIVLGAALKLEPHRITYYLLDLATAFHYFYERHRVVSDDTGRSRARLYLCQLTKKVLKEGLTLLGVSAPERM
jgi:arginyl-tRNA synthetase